jgi:hypothetical protein
MPRSVIRLALAGLVAGASLFAVSPAQSAGLSLLAPKPIPVVAPVAPLAAQDPVGRVPVGTMIMVHAGGWAGHDAHAQSLLMDRPGDLLVQRGWRVVSVDYNEGAQGLQDVLDVAGSELARNSSDGPLCIYGESAGAHLALMAAARLRAIDCVIGLGTPTDLPLYESQAQISSDARVRLVGSQITRLFGATPEAMTAWSPLALAPTIHADVLLIHEADDQIVGASQGARFVQARPTTQLVELEAGDPANQSTAFIHGTVSEAGRGQYLSAVGSFADRAVAAGAAERGAAATRCPSVSRSTDEVGLAKVKSALRCLARSDAAARSARTTTWKRTKVMMRGEVNAARVWSRLRRTTSGLSALGATAKLRTKLTVLAGDRSQIVLRAISR